MVPPAGLEPARLSTTASKAAVSAVPPQGLNGPPGRTRTCDLSVRSRTLSIQLSYGGGVMIGATLVGLKPETCRLGGGCSFQLSYRVANVARSAGLEPAQDDIEGRCPIH